MCPFEENYVPLKVMNKLTLNEPSTMVAVLVELGIKGQGSGVGAVLVLDKNSTGVLYVESVGVNGGEESSSWPPPLNKRTCLIRIHLFIDSSRCVEKRCTISFIQMGLIRTLLVYCIGRVCAMGVRCPVLHHPHSVGRPPWFVCVCVCGVLFPSVLSQKENLPGWDPIRGKGGMWGGGHLPAVST